MYDAWRIQWIYGKRHRMCDFRDCCPIPRNNGWIDPIVCLLRLAHVVGCCAVCIALDWVYWCRTSVCGYMNLIFGKNQVFHMEFMQTMSVMCVDVYCAVFSVIYVVFIVFCVDAFWKGLMNVMAFIYRWECWIHQTIIWKALGAWDT